MEAIDQNPEVYEPLPGTGLGGRLVAAREARGLTHADVTRELRLSAATQQALESSRYEDLPAPIYVRGYLRAYARLLKMDEEALLAEYNPPHDTPEPVTVTATMAHHQATVPKLYLRGAAALIAVAVVVTLGSWWYSRQTQAIPAQSRTATSETTAAASAALPPAQVSSRNQGPAEVEAHPPDITSQALTSEAAEVSVPVTEAGAPADKAAAAAEPSLPLVSEPPVSAKKEKMMQRREAEATVKPAIQDLPVAPLVSEKGRLVRASRAPAGEDVLIIKTNDESWVEVVDENSYQLLYYLLQPGRVYSLQGKAPFQVFLGNAPAVELSLNQERFDHVLFHRRNGTARFSVEGGL